MHEYPRLSPLNRQRVIWYARTLYLSTRPHAIPFWGTLAAWPIIIFMTLLMGLR